MTTIAYRDGSMASDTMGVGDSVCRGKIKKIERLSDGSLLGIAGDSGYHQFFREWFPSGFPFRTHPRLPDGADINLLYVTAEGKIFQGSGRALIMVEIDAPYFAIGSGNEFALGAMAHGASARHAVELAAKFDLSTNDEVDVLRLPLKSRGED